MHLHVHNDHGEQMGWDPVLRGFGARLASTSIETVDSTIIHQIAGLYARKLDVLNRGFSGYNTDWALPVWGQVCRYTFVNMGRHLERDLARSSQSGKGCKLTHHECDSSRSGLERMTHVYPGFYNTFPFPGFQRT